MGAHSCFPLLQDVPDRQTCAAAGRGNGKTMGEATTATKPRPRPTVGSAAIAAFDTPVVHVIDDDLRLGRSLSNLLESADIGSIVHASAEGFLAAWAPTLTGCILLDIHMPGLNGLDFQDQLSDVRIPLPVILMTGNADIPSSIRGLKAGAVDFLLKPFSGDQLCEAVRIGFIRDAARVTTELERAAVLARHERLTPRERQVLVLAATGLLNKQIAAELGVTEVTVKVHRHAMMRKMGARSVVELVRIADILDAATRSSATPSYAPYPAALGGDWSELS